METLIRILPNWQLEFHVHTDASLLVVGPILAHNPTGKYDQPTKYFLDYSIRHNKIILLHKEKL
jgi:hypothetical protein